MQLLTVNNAKTVKGEPLGWLTGIQYLPPAFQTKTFNTCPKASPLCKRFCLVNAGNLGHYPEARHRRLELLLEKPELYYEKLKVEIYELLRQAEKRNLKVAVRLNGTSDIIWESKKMHHILPRLMKEFPQVVFYDYTKIAARCTEAYKKKYGIENYKLTFSRSEVNHEDAVKLLGEQNVAVVFNVKKTKALPAMWEGTKVIDGDKSDLRFLDPKGVVVGLRYKNSTIPGAAATNAAAKQSTFIIQ